MDIANQLKKVAVAIDQNGFVAAAENLTIQMMSAIEALRIYAVYVSHGARNIGFRCMNKHVVMVGHQAVGGNSDIPRLGSFLKQFNKSLVIEFV